MDGSGEQPSLQITAASEVKVKVELTNGGSYECFICNHSVRPQLKHALAAATDARADGMLDEANLVLNCPLCTGEVYHAACGGADFRTLCSTCSQETVEQRKPWSKPHAPWESSGAARKSAAAEDADDERVGGVPSEPAASSVCAKSKFLPLKEALLYARSLKLKSKAEWELWSKSGGRPAYIPSTPAATYKHAGWQGYGHWLNTGNAGVKKDQQFLPFKDALLYARSLKLKSRAEWWQWCKSKARPANMPTTPHKIYKHDGWQGCGHWLGTGTVAPQDQQFLPFKRALLYARSLKLKSEKGWKGWSKSGARPANIPSTPAATYKHAGWQGYGHWVGTGTVANKDHQFLPFKKALLYARSLKLKSEKGWRVWSKSGARPANMPASPRDIYMHEGWQGYRHWLGTS